MLEEHEVKELRDLFEKATASDKTIALISAIAMVSTAYGMLREAGFRPELALAFVVRSVTGREPERG